MIEVSHITKTYRVARRDAGFLHAFHSLFHREYERIRALDDVSFTIQDGEMVGYIGPNGAGKSSTIKILSGILTPDSGECRINGRVPWENRWYSDSGPNYGGMYRWPILLNCSGIFIVLTRHFTGKTGTSLRSF